MLFIVEAFQWSGRMNVGETPTNSYGFGFIQCWGRTTGWRVRYQVRPPSFSTKGKQACEYLGKRRWLETEKCYMHKAICVWVIFLIPIMACLIQTLAWLSIFYLLWFNGLPCSASLCLEMGEVPQPATFPCEAIFAHWMLRHFIELAKHDSWSFASQWSTERFSIINVLDFVLKDGIAVC